MGKKSSTKKVKREELKEKITETKKISEEPKKTVIEQSEKPESQAPQMREIVIQTDGTSIRIVKNETAGNLELLAVLQALMGSLTSPK